MKPKYVIPKTFEAVSGYIRSIIDIPNDIVELIHTFYDKIISFNVYDASGKNYMKNCKNLVLNSEAYFFVNDKDVLYVRGLNNSGQTGITGLGCTKIRISELTEHKYFKDKNVELISHGIVTDHTIINTSNGLYVFGNNVGCQLGISTDISKVNSPLKLDYVFKSKLKQIKCGYSHSLFLTEIGNVYGSGQNGDGQLSNKYISNSDNIIQCIINTNNISYIDCCQYSSYFLNTNNQLKATGYNGYGELGINSEFTGKSDELKLACNGNNVKQFCCGGNYIGVLTSNNTLWMYGSNTFGQCGMDNPSTVTVCIKGNKIKLIDNNEIIISVKCGLNRTIIKTNNNNYYGFGNNKDDKLLCGLANNLYRPTFIILEYIYHRTKSNNIILDIIPSYTDTFILQKVD